VLTAVNRQQTPPILNQYLLFRPGDPVTGLAQRFLDVYDLDKDYHLSREECPLDEPLFNRLDRDGNGQLDVPELAEFFSHAVPDLESWFNLDGQNAVGALSRFSFRPDSVTAKSIGRTVRVQLKGGESLDLGDPAMAVFNRGAARLNVRQSLTQSFKIVAGEKGYIDEKDVQAPNGRALQPYFVVGDRNGDGRLTMDELNAFIELHMKLPEATLSLSAFRQSVNWFAALDANRDGRLSRRELREAWKSLAALQESPGETISPPDKVDRLQLVIHQGTNIYFNAAQGYLNPQAPRPSSAGPLWFRKMDRNGDGFVSRREFLGTKEEFDRIDRDGDGLIDPDEAERATPRK
jgi:Ca2+-binding EF-hand superfamily protein